MKFSEKLQIRERYSHVRESENGMILLDYMAENFRRFDREQWAEIIRKQKVEVNNIIAGCATILKKHDKVSLFEELQAEPQVNLSYKSVYEDEYFVVLDKGADLCVHPTGKFYQHTLWYQAGKKYGELFFIGRLDRETSGLIIGARSKEIAALMQGKDFDIYKEYQVLVHGRFDKYLRCTGFLSRDEKSIIPKKRRFTFEEVEKSEKVDTEFFPQKSNDDFSLVKAVLHSGRMHQIRATLFSIGFPVVGDKLYGLDETMYNKIPTQTFTAADRVKLILPNQALHCCKLEFYHPVSKALISVSSTPDFVNFLKAVSG